MRRALPTLALLACAATAHAAGPLPVDGAKLSTSDYRVAYFTGPVLASSSVTGLSGAYQGLSVGVEGTPVNPASPAVRTLYSWDRVDYDLTLSITLSPAPANRVDLLNDGNPTSSSTLRFATVGGALQIGKWGVSLTIDDTSYELANRGAAAETHPFLDVDFAIAHLAVARTFFDGQLSLGVGIRGCDLNIDQFTRANGSGDKAAGPHMTGSGIEGGFVVLPRGLQARFGFTARAPVASKLDSGAQSDANGDVVSQGFYLPTEVVLPWEVEAGAAFELGARPLNPEPFDQDAEIAALMANEGLSEEDAKKERRLRARARYEALEREHLLVTASLLVSGPTANAVNVDSFLRQTVQRSGRHATVTPRVGVEWEAVPRWLQLRGGSYVEPSRVGSTSPRVHGTIGYDVKVFPWTVFGLFDETTWWRIGGFSDASRAYFAFGGSFGVWH